MSDLLCVVPLPGATGSFSETLKKISGISQISLQETKWDLGVRIGESCGGESVGEDLYMGDGARTPIGFWVVGVGLAAGLVNLATVTGSCSRA